MSSVSNKIEDSIPQLLNSNNNIINFNNNSDSTTREADNDDDHDTSDIASSIEEYEIN